MRCTTCTNDLCQSPDHYTEDVIAVFCAWCNADLGTKPGYGITGTSDGICKTCVEHFFPEYVKPDEAEEMSHPSIMVRR